MSFIDKVKDIVSGFLATENSKYITTQDGLKLFIFDKTFVDKQANTGGSWGEKPVISAGWDDKIKTP
jgi:hypothetical protein